MKRKFVNGDRIIKPRRKRLRSVCRRSCLSAIGITCTVPESQIVFVNMLLLIASYCFLLIPICWRQDNSIAKKRGKENSTPPTEETELPISMDQAATPTIRTRGMQTLGVCMSAFCPCKRNNCHYFSMKPSSLFFERLLLRIWHRFESAVDTVDTVFEVSHPSSAATKAVRVSAAAARDCAHAGRRFS